MMGRGSVGGVCCQRSVGEGLKGGVPSFFDTTIRQRAEERGDPIGDPWTCLNTLEPKGLYLERRNSKDHLLLNWKKSAYSFSWLFLLKA